ncbi:hypothetical protein IWW45_002051 [Coemansia sp. RSA 485]|nr:hypothetical protein IWW45_002051 [Coemansia sp. RSA 485]
MLQISTQHLKQTARVCMAPIDGSVHCADSYSGLKYGVVKKFCCISAAGRYASHEFPQPEQLLPGYEAEVAGLVAEISGYFKHKDRFQHLNIKPVQSIYVSGITGIGKTTVIRRSLGRLRYPVVYGNLRDIVVNASGTDFAEEYISMALNDLADRARAAAPSVIVLDRVDILNDKELMEETEGAYGKFSSFVESIADGVFLVLESSVDAADMHVATRKTSALQHSQVIPIPNLQRRCEIVLWAIEKYMGATKDSHDSDLSKSVSIDQLAKQVANATAGYVARDIIKLCRQSFLRMLRENPRLPHDRECDLAEELKNMTLGPTAGKKLMLGWEHFSESLQLVRPSQHLEFEGVRPTKRWKDIGGYGSTKQALQRFMKLATGESRSALGIKAPSGILLYGPTGCGKTAMALAMIGESACNVIYIRGSELFSKYLGETEARLRSLFIAARAAAPCIVFMDEVDSLAGKREWSSVESGGPALRVLSTLLNELDGVHETRGVVAVGCTNRVDSIDDAIIRPGKYDMSGRFDQLVEICMPSLNDRVGILQTLGGKSQLGKDVCIERLAQMTEGFSGADIEQLFREAGLAAMRKNRDAEAMEMSDFLHAIDKI